MNRFDKKKTKWYRKKYQNQHIRYSNRNKYKNGYLPGGTISIVWDNLADLVTKTWNKDKLGRWSSILIGRENRVIEIITIY